MRINQLYGVQCGSLFFFDSTSCYVDETRDYSCYPAAAELFAVDL